MKIVPPSPPKKEKLAINSSCALSVKNNQLQWVGKESICVPRMHSEGFGAWKQWVRHLEMSGKNFFGE